MTSTGAGGADSPGTGGGSAGGSRSVLDPDTAEAAPAPAPPRKRRWPKVLLIIALALAIIASLAVAGLWQLAKRLERNVATIDGFVADAPVESYEPVNFLILGSDDRGNGNTATGETAEINGQRSDTTLLVHISGDRDRALVVSIPRDTKLQLPVCASQSGQWQPTAKFNSAFTFGGANCAVEAVEDLTGVDIHHAAVVDFLGFKHVVDALGGVDVCLTEDVYDADSGLDLPAGWSTVTGDQALAFVRARKSLGDGSDISRIERQQQFISSAIRQATDAGILLKPVTLYRMLDAATQALTVDSGLDEIGELAAMATSLRGLRPANITFVTMPFNYSSDGLDVLVNQSVAQEIWTAMRNDQPWPSAASQDGEALTVSPSDISVLIANGTGLDDAATGAAADLQGRGFRIAGAAPADSTGYGQSVVVHHPADTDAARTLQSAVPDSVLRSDASAPVGQLQLIVGASYIGSGALDVPRVPEGTYADPLPVTADKSVCAS